MFWHCEHIFWLNVRRDLMTSRGDAVRKGAKATQRTSALIERITTEYCSALCGWPVPV